jgi:diacylglycerol kinase (ATP)
MSGVTTTTGVSTIGAAGGGLIDVDADPDSIQAEEELIEAVHEVFETVKVTVCNEIESEVSEFLHWMYQWLVRIFPMIVTYRNNPAFLYQDLQHASLFGLVLIITIWILRPSKRSHYSYSHHHHYHQSRGQSTSFLLGISRSPGRRRRKRDRYHHHHPNIRHGTFWNCFGSFSSGGSWGDGGGGNSSIMSDTDRSVSFVKENDNADDDEEDDDEEMDEERFEKVWMSLVRSAKYARLVLPPTCRRVVTQKTKNKNTAPTPSSTKHIEPPITNNHDDDDNNNKDNKSSSSSRNNATNPRVDDEEEEEEDPAERITNYLRHLWYFIRFLISYDFNAAGWTLIVWLQGIYRHRRSTSSVSVEPPNDIPPLAEPNICDTHNIADGSNSNQGEKPLWGSGEAPIIDGDDNNDNNNNNISIVHEHQNLCRVEENEIHTSSDESSIVLVANGDAEIKEHVGKLPQKHVLSPVVIADRPGLSQSPLQHTPPPPPTTTMTKPCKSNQQLNKELSPQCFQQHHPMQSGAPPPLPSLTHSDRTSSAYSVYLDPEEQIASSRMDTTASSQKFNPSQQKQQLERKSVSSYLPQDILGIPDSHSAISSCGSKSHLIENETPRSPPLRHSGKDSVSHFFDTATSRESLQKISVAVPVPDKNGYILGDDFLPDPTLCTPLLVFVNSRSGPQQGYLLITQLRRLLNPIQIWDLADGGPRTVLESFLSFSRLRLLVCGGDGTVAWIIHELEEMKIPPKKWPAIGILPLGTGNDLARIHGWGGGYNNEPLVAVLEQIAESYVSLLDRWEVKIQDKKIKKQDIKSFFNYLGIGADAQAALQVHYLRESRPRWFFSRLINKAMYAVFGAEDIIKSSNVHLRREIKLIADGVEVPLPSDSQGIIFLNIDSYAGGVPLWSHGIQQNSVGNNFHYPRRSHSLTQFELSSGPRNLIGSIDRTDSADDLHKMLSTEEQYARVTACDMPSSCQDGYLDVVSIRGAFHLGQIKVGLSNAVRICQCREATITIRNKVAVQVDGEPWRQRACYINIKRKKDTAVMLHRSADDGGVEMEMSKLLDWAEERQMIDSQVHSILMKEFSRRIESKTRQRRVKEQENLMTALKKAISSGTMTNLAGLQQQNRWHREDDTIF